MAPVISGVPGQHRGDEVRRDRRPAGVRPVADGEGEPLVGDTGIRAFLTVHEGKEGASQVKLTLGEKGADWTSPGRGCKGIQGDVQPAA